MGKRMRNLLALFIVAGLSFLVGYALSVKTITIQECKTNSDIEGVDFSRECNGRLTISYQDGITTLVCKEP